MPRLFIGIMLPPQDQPELLALLPDCAQIKPSLPGQLHLTLNFPGAVSEAVSSALQHSLSNVRSAPFTMVLTGTGVFPQDSGVRGVLWVGVRLSEPLQRLHAAVTAVVQNAGLPLESRPWSPHITLARYSGGPPEDLQRFLRRGQRVHAEFVVDAFQLMQSRPGPTGSVYTPLAVFPLN
ncbi:MAG: RNA 2',3'-cyclic phosphodiesterase [Planctomycetaceae bacterium]